ncbi:MAG: 50S ribosomal protein L29 [Candidatus Saccharimonadales bacterium]
MATTKPAKTTKSIKKDAVEVKSLEQLTVDLATKRNDLLEAKRGNRAGELVNPRVITLTRKDIARLKTAIRAEQLKEGVK